MEIESSGTSSTENYGSCLNEESPPERRLDVSRLIDTFDPDEIDEIKLAADFLLGAQCHEDAFVLYVVLLKRLNDTSDHREWISTFALIGCARSAATSPQFEIVRNLLEQKLSHLADYSQSSAESFLLRSLLADLHRKDGDEAASEFHNRLAMQSDFVKTGSLLSLPHNNRNFDLITYQYLHRSLASRGSLLRARSVTKELLQREPGPFEHEEGHMRNTSVRSCLQWCVEELRQDHRISGSWMNLRQQGIYRGLETVLGLFCNLWQRWQRSAAKLKSSAASMQWTRHVEQVMGISPAELLSITCLMMLNACSTLEDILHLNFVFDHNLGLRALLGGQKIAAVPDEDLAHAFLEAYSTLNSPDQKGFDNPSHSSLARDYAKSWLQQSLQLELPEACQSSGPGLSQAIAKFNASQTSIPKSLWPTIASSQCGLR
jgi:hypothetical protein